MITAIVPTKNEEGRIHKLISHLLEIDEIDNIIVVINGSNDGTISEVKKFKSSKIIPLLFPMPLGIDIPRAVGAAYALHLNSELCLFIDGDLIGDITEDLREMLWKTKVDELDMALANCYPSLPEKNSIARHMIFFREMLNKEAGLFEKIFVSSPSHGPHLVSRKLLNLVPLKELAIPPVSMILAKKNNLKIEIAAQIPHYRLGSSLKNNSHTLMVSETIIGDNIEALKVCNDEPRNRFHEGKEYIGYHKQRRFDLLQRFQKNPTSYIWS